MLKFLKNGIKMSVHYVKKKRMITEDLCITPSGQSYYKHDMITENFHHFCKNCGMRHGLPNTKAEIDNYSRNTVFQI